MCFRETPRPPLPTVPQVPLRRGDVIVVGRIVDWRAWLTGPLAAAISWKIQESTNSIWNHVACYIGRGQIAEAEWNRGVRVASISEYLTGEYRIAVVRPPDCVNREDACERWLDIVADSKGRRSYSLRTLILMRCAGLLFGAEGIANVVRNNPADGAWICSEVGAFGWEGAGLARASERLITPADFLKPAIALELDLDQLIVPHPSALKLEN